MFSDNPPLPPPPLPQTRTQTHKPILRIDTERTCHVVMRFSFLNSRKRKTNRVEFVRLNALILLPLKYMYYNRLRASMYIYCERLDILSVGTTHAILYLF